MLTSNDLLTCDCYPQLSDVSLELYRDFSENVLMNRCFRYTLFDDSEIYVEFREFGIYHMLGIQHINGRINKESFFSEINGGLSFSSFEATPSIRSRFKNNKPRIRMFANTYNALRVGEFFYCPSGAVPNRDNVKMDYIIYRNISGKGLNIGLRKLEETTKDTYTPLTILVSKQSDPEIYIDRSNIKIIKKLVIEDLQSGAILETVVHSDSFLASLT